MPSLGVPELIIIFLIIIVLFGANRIPTIGRGLGEGIRQREILDRFGDSGHRSGLSYV